MLRARVFAKIKTEDLLTDFNNFLLDNKLTDLSKINAQYNNNVIFCIWSDETSHDRLDTLNKQPATQNAIPGSTNETPKYIDSGCG